jgi:hypothetical protein
MSATATKETLAFQPPHALNPKEKEFVNSMGAKQKELHDLATKMLGSSYFVGKTHAYTKWVSSQSAATLATNTNPSK